MILILLIWSNGFVLTAIISIIVTRCSVKKRYRLCGCVTLCVSSVIGGKVGTGKGTKELKLLLKRTISKNFEVFLCSKVFE